MTIRTGILCVPDHDDEAIDRVSQLLRSTIPDLYVIESTSAKSQLHWIEDLLCRWCDEDELDLVVTIGGTFPAVGPSAAEIVPEATENVIERLLPGLSEAMRAYAQNETPLALLDCGIAGIRGRSVVLNLPEGAAAAYLFLEAVVDLIVTLLACLDDEKPSPRLANELILEDVEPDTASGSNRVEPESGSNTSRIELESKFLLDNTECLSKEQNVSMNPKKKGLDPAEFAEYLARRASSSSEASDE